MSRSRLRILALPVVAVGAVALFGITAGTANAADIVSGTGTVTVSLSSVAGLAKADVVAVPTGEQSVTYDNTGKTFSVVYSVTGGDADLNTFAGEVAYQGGVTLVNAANGKSVKLGGLQFDLLDDQLDFTPAGGDPVPLFDLGGSQAASVNGASQTFSAAGLQVDPAGASYLDSALGTSAFQTTAQIGSFTTSYSR